MKTINDQIIEIEYILTGSIITKFGSCGKEGCRCARDKKYWHGPYYVWTRKEKGKTITKSLSVTQARFCKKAIKNMKKLKMLIEKWKLKSIKIMDNEI